MSPEERAIRHRADANNATEPFARDPYSQCAVDRTWLLAALDAARADLRKALLAVEYWQAGFSKSATADREIALIAERSEAERENAALRSELDAARTSAGQLHADLYGMQDGSLLRDLQRENAALREALREITDHFAGVMGGPMITGSGVEFANGVEGIPTIAKARRLLGEQP